MALDSRPIILKSGDHLHNTIVDRPLFIDAEDVVVDGVEIRPPKGSRGGTALITVAHPGARIFNVIGDATNFLYGVQTLVNFTTPPKFAKYTVVDHCDFFASKDGALVNFSLLQSSRFHHTLNDGVKINTRGFVEVNNCTIDHLGFQDPTNPLFEPGPHADGIQLHGCRNVRITNGTNIEVPHPRTANGSPLHESNSAIFVETNFGPVDNLIVDGVRMNGGNFCVYIRQQGTTYPPPTNVVIQNCFAGRDFVFKFFSMTHPELVRLVNTRWEDTGELLTKQS